MSQRQGSSNVRTCEWTSNIMMKQASRKGRPMGLRFGLAPAVCTVCRPYLCRRRRREMISYVSQLQRII